MRHKIRRTAVLAALLLALALSLSGCEALENTEIVLTTGLSGNQLFKVGKSVCTLPEAMIYMMDYQEQYESVYGVEMWEHDFGGVTLEEYVKGLIVSQLAQIKAVTLLGDEYEVELDEDEEERVKDASHEYYSLLGKDLVSYMNLKESDVENLCRDHALSEKIYAEITKDVNTEVSDDEARIITVQQIRLKTEDEAHEVLAKLREGQDFGTLAAAYSLDLQITFTFGRGETDAALEEAAFNLETDEVSQIIETEDGFYLLHCTDNFDQEATEANKVTLVSRRRDEVFGEVYDALIEETPSEFNDRLWEDVHFSGWEGEIPANFLGIYESYFGSE